MEKIYEVSSSVLSSMVWGDILEIKYAIKLKINALRITYLSSIFHWLGVSALILQLLCTTLPQNAKRQARLRLSVVY